MKTKLLFCIDMHYGKEDDVESINLTAKNDIVARAKALPHLIRAVNIQLDRAHAQDLENWSSGDLPLRLRDYKHITEKDVTYCEITLRESWKE